MEDSEKVSVNLVTGNSMNKRHVPDINKFLLFA